MTNSFWRPSDEQRRTILLMEALGLIHDLGKMSDLLLKSQDPSLSEQYGYNLLSDPRTMDIYKHYTDIPGNPSAEFIQEILNTSTHQVCAFSERADLNNLLTNIKLTWISEQYRFAELMPLLTKTKLSVNKDADWNTVVGKSMQPGLLIGYLHGIAHIDKEGDPREHQQPYSSVFRATPFGYENQVGTEGVNELTKTLNKLPLNDIEKITTFQRSQWLEEMKVLMKRGLADNRRPHNEISLWDWGYSVATLTKAATNYIFKNGWLPNLKDLPFCTLRINLDILERYKRSDKISDLLGVKQVFDDAFKEVQILFEETYALGNKLYRDETGAYYLLPDIFSGSEQIALREQIQSLFPADLRPQVYFSTPITADALHHVQAGEDNSHSDRANTHKGDAQKLVAGSRTEALKEKSISADNNLYLFKREWKQDRPENAEICKVCGMRPVGYPRQDSQTNTTEKLSPLAKQKKAEQRKICRVCLNRQGRRSQQWVKDINQKSPQNTIWTDEVADDNGRLALFVGKLGLEGWLDGTLLSTIQVTKKNNVTKNPSPARLYRIAETSRVFWENIVDNVMPTVVQAYPFRLELHSENNNLADIGDYHAYDLDFNGVVLSVVWDLPNKRFLTTDNLNYFAAQLSVDTTKIIGELQGKIVRVSEPSSFLQASKSKTTVKIQTVRQIDRYRPAIPLLTEPTLCLMLVPANKALELAHQVKKEYEEQMGRVRDRLPLDIGLIFCNRRTPIRSVLEAGRAMLNISSQFDMYSGKGWEGWRLMKQENSGGFCKLDFDNGITWKTPIVVGDGSKKDEWYPRLYQGFSWGKEGHKPELRHIFDLRPRTPQMPKDKGQKVWVRPSHFDFEFLDSTARRFEIYYDENGRRPRQTRPFYLEDLDRFEKLWDILKTLETSQRHQIIHTIEATRETWYGQDEKNSALTDDVFKQFVEDTLANAAWRKDKKWWSIPEAERQQLIQAGVRGELADLAELHMEILKER
ncbi:hypothetical protein [Oscillatoria sp. FACHB-1406]|uniref:hypothetical protein n=1 Tax=Oscillatoria sp. FACHB-1406 TaxID=2692846 RepID=UPI0016834AA5|nr:hypothetical protein [Oscillatoria sp. FACHB-1406]MBD2578557.1 hypothetical protein [Oscillatoria sp. FACHB-1406]